MYYDYSIVDGYNAPVVVIVAKRGIGKTFGRVIRCIKRFKDYSRRFIYVVETEDMVDVLSQNRGEKFFSKIIEYLQKQKSNKAKKLLNYITSAQIEETEKISTGGRSNIRGGTIYINGNTAGYIVSLSGFSKLKRNNFTNVHEIVVDEFIPETIDARSLKNTYKLVNVIQSIARTQTDIKIYLLGNAVRMNDDILVKLKLNNMKLGEIRKIYDKYGLFIVAHYVDNEEYKEFEEIANKSVAGRLASITGQDNEETNTFVDEVEKDLLIPQKMKSSHFIFALHDDTDSIRIHATKDYSCYYVIEDYGTNKTGRYCIDPKGITSVVKYVPEYKDYVLKLYNNNLLKFENSYVYMIFKKILKIL